MYEYSQIVNSVPGIPGPPGPPGPTGPGYVIINRSISALTTDNSDTNVATSIKGLVYRISAATADGLKAKTLVCNVTRESVSVSDTVGFKVGALNLGVENLIMTGTHMLRLTNNETQPIVVTILKETY